MCMHGERQVALRTAAGTVIPLATHHEGLRLNSPNDLTVTQNGDVYFTDPSYGYLHMELRASSLIEHTRAGLNRHEKDEARELDMNSVYRIPFSAIEVNCEHFSPLCAQPAFQAAIAGNGDAKTAAVKMNAANGFARPNGIAVGADHASVFISDSHRDLSRWEVSSCNARFQIGHHLMPPVVPNFQE